MKMRGEGIHPPLSSLTKMNGTTTRKEPNFTRLCDLGSVYAEMPPQKYYTRRKEKMQKKFSIGDTVIFTSAHYKAHMYHAGEVVDVTTTPISEGYPGTRVTYVVKCTECDKTLTPKAYHMAAKA